MDEFFLRFIKRLTVSLWFLNRCTKMITKTWVLQSFRSLVLTGDAQISSYQRLLLTPMASVGITLAGVSVVCVPFPGRAQSVLTCVTCASAVWLVDWINIGWVSSCPAGIVTCCIWYNCCKTETGRRYADWIIFKSAERSSCLSS